MANIRKFVKGANIKLSKNIHLSEWDCKCHHPECQTTLVDLEMVERLQKERDRTGLPILITCGYRCKKHNQEVGGVGNSIHQTGGAVDFQMKNKTPEEVANMFEDCNGLGRYDTFTHADNRDLGEKGIKARWNFRRKK